MSTKPFELAANIKVLSDTSEDGKIFIEGYANTATKDRVGDLIPSSAWTDEAIKNFMDRQPVMLFNHSYSAPIGSFSTIERHEKGLYVKGWIYDNWEHSQKVIDGVLRSFSVHFNTDWSNWEWSNEMDCFICKKIDDIYEISIATIPANADSTFTVAKSLGEDFAEFKKSHTPMNLFESLKSLLSKKKDGTLTESEAKQLEEIVNENSELLKSLMKTEEAVEEETTEEEEATEKATEEDQEVEETEESETEKSLKAELENIKKELAEEKARNAKPKTATAKSPDPRKETGALSDSEKALEDSANALRNHSKSVYR